ncbi:helix-turn-helix domain-containing protein [Nocardia sp. NPDC057440]|uniref:helix-turn-helix domain-containing protein n=1 Tax=Nocardia sp. NPDC057440 TaxID=3346134 RepID=UPI00366ED9A1
MDTERLGNAINKAVGDELRGLRAKRKISREELRKRTGLGLSTIQRFENGERSPDLPQLTLILRALDMPMQEFVALALRDVEGIE